MAYEHFNTKKLVKKIKERKKFLTGVVNFAEELISKKEREIERHQESCNTRADTALFYFISQ